LINIEETELTYAQKLYEKKYLIGPITCTCENKTFIVQYDKQAKVSKYISDAQIINEK